MHNYWNLVHFEYKKILSKRSIQIALCLTFVTVIFSCFGTVLGNYYIDGEIVCSNYEAMVTERNYDRTLAGSKLKEDLIMEAVEAYKKVPLIPGKFTDLPEYQKYARPYSTIRSLISSTYNQTIVEEFDLEAMQNLTKEQAADFYQYREQKIQSVTDNYPLNAHSKEILNHLADKVKTPFVVDYIGGYDRYQALLITVGLISMFVIAICIAPLFAGEYTTHVDQLILSTRHGKKELIYAKVFTGLTLSVAVQIILLGACFLTCMSIFGWDGIKAPIQLSSPLNIYPINMLQATILSSICSIMAGVLIAGVSMYLSSRLKTSFGVIILTSILIIAPMFIQVESTGSALLYRLVNLLPINMTTFWNTLDPILYEFGPISVKPYIFMPIFSLLFTLCLLPFTIRCFRKHQVG